MASVDTEHRRLCHTLFDALESGDDGALAACYAPGMTLWFNITGQESTREENLAAVAQGRELLRRRTYNDRTIHTFDDGFVAQYSVNVVTHDGSSVALWGCLVAEVHDGLIVKLSDYLDSTKFATSGRPSGSGEVS
jgi:ketosteroid isomerase-like protein